MRLPVMLLPLLLVSCQTPEPVKVPVPYAVKVYPELPPVKNFDKDFPMDDVEFDVPRDMKAAPFLSADPACKGKVLQDLSADDPCLIFPPDSLSNLYIGLDQENADRLRLNLSKLAEKEKLRDLQDEQVNKQREDWRAKNELARKELEARPVIDDGVTDQDPDE